MKRCWFSQLTDMTHSCALNDPLIQSFREHVLHHVRVLFDLRHREYHCLFHESLVDVLFRCRNHFHDLFFILTHWHMDVSLHDRFWPECGNDVQCAGHMYFGATPYALSFTLRVILPIFLIIWDTRVPVRFRTRSCVSSTELSGFFNYQKIKFSCIIQSCLCEIVFVTFPMILMIGRTRMSIISGTDVSTVHSMICCDNRKCGTVGIFSVTSSWIGKTDVCTINSPYAHVVNTVICEAQRSRFFR